MGENPGRQFDFITIGTGTRDIFFQVTDGKVVSAPSPEAASQLYLGFQYGAKIITDDATFSYGGGALNTALGLAKMGLRGAAAFRIGREGTGDVLLAEMEKQGVDRRYVERDPELHTGLSFVINVPGADHVLFHYLGAGARLELPDLTNIEAEWLYLTSLTGPAAALLPLIEERVREAKMKLVFNPGQTQINAGLASLRGLLRLAHVLIVNKREAADLVHEAVGGPRTDSIAEMFTQMRAWGPRLIVITDGRAGSYAHDGEQAYYLPAFPADAVDTTGAGDSFGAGFISGLINYRGDIERSLTLATANAASVVSQYGAHGGALTQTEAEALAQKNSDITVKLI